MQYNTTKLNVDEGLIRWRVALPATNLNRQENTMDNAIFRVNGPLEKEGGFDFLLNAVELALRQKGFDGINGIRPSGWSFSPATGLVFYWSDPGTLYGGVQYHAFSAMPGETDFKGLSAEDTANVIRKWMETEQAGDTELGQWCDNHDHDGHNTIGFLIYMDDWGHVGDSSYALFGVKPCSLWHGK